jgi:predicted nucleotidyltransferase
MNRDFVEMLSAFSASGVEYLVVGAHALAVHARPRATGDLDLWIRPTPDNAQRVMSALRNFGAPLGGVSQRDLEIPEQVLQLGVVPNRIDLLTSITGVHFESAWPRRHEVSIEGVQVPILGREDLIRNKRATGRAQDRADLVLLEAEEGGAR